MRRVHPAAALAALLALTQTAMAVSAAQSDEAIIVEGQRVDVPTLVRATINNIGVTPIARFEGKICPGVVGVGGDQATRMLQMVRDNVAALGGTLAPPGCTANATVIFVDQPVDFVKKLAKTQPAYVTMSPRAFDRFVGSPRPVVSWHVTETRSRDGQELGSSDKISDPKKKLFGVPASTSVPMDAKVNRQSGATRLYTNVREEMAVAFAVIDRASSGGKSLRQLADLATLHLLLDIKQTVGASHRGSILSLFEERTAGASPPPALSQYDRAMVQALYAPHENNRTAAQQYSQIASAVRNSAGSSRP